MLDFSLSKSDNTNSGFFEKSSKTRMFFFFFFYIKLSMEKLENVIVIYDVSTSMYSIPFLRHNRNSIINIE